MRKVKTSLYKQYKKNYVQYICKIKVTLVKTHQPKAFLNKQVFRSFLKESTESARHRDGQGCTCEMGSPIICCM